MKIIGGKQSEKLLQAVEKLTDFEIVDVNFKKFNDGETSIEIKESLLSEDVIIIQSTCNPVNDNLMEIILLTDVLKREMINSISLVVPYFGYARQDRQMQQASPVSAKVVASILSQTGIDKIAILDLHSEHTANLFDVCCLNISSSSIFVDYIKKQKIENFVVVAPDFGAMKRARIVANELECDVVVLEKKRASVGKSEVVNVFGSIAGKNCIIVDDIIDGGGTIFNAAETLKEKGALDVWACVTHGVCSSNDFVAKLEQSSLKKLVITDTINKELRSEKINYLSIAEIIANYIKSYVL